MLTKTQSKQLMAAHRKSKEAARRYHLSDFQKIGMVGVVALADKMEDADDVFVAMLRLFTDERSIPLIEMKALSRKPLKMKDTGNV